MSGYILTFTVVDRERRILVSIVEPVTDNDHADRLIAEALLKLSACDCIITKCSLTEATQCATS